MKELIITVSVHEGEEVDIVVVEDGEVGEHSHVKRAEYVENRWGRYHNVRDTATRMVERAMRRWTP